MPRKEWSPTETGIALYYASRSVSHHTIRVILKYHDFDRTETAIADRLRLLRKGMPSLWAEGSWREDQVDAWIHDNGILLSTIVDAQARAIIMIVLVLDPELANYADFLLSGIQT
jgi:hypothetical protein